MENELFGTSAEKDHTGINFSKYDDIPVEVSGRDTPAPIDKVYVKKVDGLCVLTLHLLYSLPVLLLIRIY